MLVKTCNHVFEYYIKAVNKLSPITTSYMSASDSGRADDNDRFYWIGPYSVLIPACVGSVRAEDGGNTHYRNGMQTEMGVGRPWTEQRWKEKYAVQRGYLWYYNMNSENIHRSREMYSSELPKTKLYWVGPYDVLVSQHIQSVTAADGCNVLDCDGEETEMGTDEPWTEKQWKTQLAEQRGCLWYYKDGTK